MLINDLSNNIKSPKTIINEAKRSNRMNNFNNVHVVPFEDKYAGVFKRLNLEWIEKYFEVEEKDKKHLDHPRENIIERGGEIYSVIEEGRVMGVCALVYSDDGVYEIAKMAVEKDARGKGYGKLLMEAAINGAKAKGGNKIVIVSNTVLEPAIRLYEKYGFETTRLGQDPNYERGNIEMELVL